MSTRGVYGFRKNGIDKLTYNHSDSYPSWLGAKIVEFIISCPLDRLHQICDSLILVDEDSIPTDEQVKECSQWFNGNVSSGTPKEWYCLLREAQHDFDTLKKGLRYMIDSGDFIKNSLFCEYGYIINLDNCELEFWQGYQKKADKNNRYGQDCISGCYPCKLVARYDLATVSKDTTEDMIKNNR